MTTVRKIVWSELFPWTLLFRTIPIALSVPVWVLATAGAVLTPVGWFISESVFINETVREDDPLFSDKIADYRSPFRGVFGFAADREIGWETVGSRIIGPVVVFDRLVGPIRASFGLQLGFRKFAYLFFGSIWTIGLWSFIGCGITRVCLLRLTRDETAGLDDAIDYCFRKFTTCFLGICIPLMAVAGLAVPNAIIGLLLIFDAGTVIAGIVWVIVLALSIVMGALLFALMFSWPLIISTVSAENQNALDAITRSFAYLIQRPLNVIFYGLVAIVIGGISWLIVSSLAVLVLHMTYWSTSWGANISSDRISLIRSEALIPSIPAATTDSENQADFSRALWIGRGIIRFWQGIVCTIAAAFLYGHFWCLASAIYLLLRRDVDETELDEIYLAEELRSYDLPPLESDEQGIPTIRPLDASPETNQEDRENGDQGSKK